MTVDGDFLAPNKTALASLQDVFAALLAKEKHIPFRNSKLTQLLQETPDPQPQTLYLPP